MGYAFVVGSCYGCRKQFSFNPLRVPSYKKQPICETCINTINKIRRKEGRDEWPVAEDAYKPIREEELP